MSRQIVNKINPALETQNFSEAIIILPFLIVVAFIRNYTFLAKAAKVAKEHSVAGLAGLCLIILTSCGGVPQFSADEPYALELKRVRSYYAAEALTNRLEGLGLETYLLTLKDENNPDNSWYVVMTGAEESVEAISTLQKTVESITKLEDIQVLDYRQVEEYITEVDQSSITELEKIIAERPDIPEDVYQLIEKFPKNNDFNVRRISLHNFTDQPIKRRFMSNYYDAQLDLPRGISKRLVADNAVAYAEVIFEDNLYGDQVTIDLMKLASDHVLDRPTELPLSEAQLAVLPPLPRSIGAFLAAKILATGRYMTEEVEVLQLSSFIELYGYKVLIEPRQGYLRTYVLLFDKNGEFALFSQSTDKTDQEILSYLEDFGKSDGMLAYNEFYNTFFTIPKCLEEGDIFLGYSSSILDNSYAASRGYVNWSKAMVGHPESSAHFYNTILEKSWVSSAFDLLTVNKKDYIYNDMYTNDTQGNKKPIDVRGQSGFFVSVPYMGYNEVNYATKGRHVMAIGGVGMSREELQKRARMFQSGISGENIPCPDGNETATQEPPSDPEPTPDPEPENPGPDTTEPEPQPTTPSSPGAICGEVSIVATFAPEARDYHQYTTPRLMLCERSKNPRCTKDFVFNTMLSTATFVAPTDDTDEMYDCKLTVTTAKNGGPIRTRIDRKNFTVISYTLPGHDFHPAKITRTMSESGGKVYVKTKEEGTAPVSDLNAYRYAMANLWSAIDGQLKAEVNRKLTTSE